MEYNTWEPKKSSWSARERRARSTVRTPFVHLFIILIILLFLDHESSGRVTHDSHKLQTKAIHHSTRHYMNRRELQSDQPIHVPLLRVLSFPPSDEHCRHSRAARATPSNHTQRYASCNCSELRCYSNTLRRFVSPEPSTKPFKRRPEVQIASNTVRPIRARALCGVMQLWPYELEWLS